LNYIDLTIIDLKYSAYQSVSINCLCDGLLPNCWSKLAGLNVF